MSLNVGLQEQLQPCAACSKVRSCKADRVATGELLPCLGLKAVVRVGAEGLIPGVTISSMTSPI